MQHQHVVGECIDLLVICGGLVHKLVACRVGVCVCVRVCVQAEADLAYVQQYDVAECIELLAAQLIVQRPSAQDILPFVVAAATDTLRHRGEAPGGATTIGPADVCEEVRTHAAARSFVRWGDYEQPIFSLPLPLNSVVFCPKCVPYYVHCFAAGAYARTHARARARAGTPR